MAFDHSSDFDAADAAADVNVLLGRAYVGLGSEGEVSVLDAERAGVLEVWAATLVPGDGEWPSAADVPAVAYIDRTIEIAVPLRGVVLRAIDDVRAEASRRFGDDFVALSFPDRVEVLRWFEGRSPLVFTLLKELTYEAYYRDRAVARVIRERTGFDTRLPVDGVELEGWDKTLELLADVAERPPLFRNAP